MCYRRVRVEDPMDAGKSVAMAKVRKLKRLEVVSRLGCAPGQVTQSSLGIGLIFNAQFPWEKFPVGQYSATTKVELV